MDQAEKLGVGTENTRCKITKIRQDVPMGFTPIEKARELDAYCFIT